MFDIERIADDLVQFIFDRDCRVMVGWIPLTYTEKSYYFSLTPDNKGHWLWQLIGVREKSSNSPYLSYEAYADVNCVTEFSSKEVKEFQKYWVGYIEICDYINSLKIPKVLLQNGVFIDVLKKAYKVRHRRLLV